MSQQRARIKVDWPSWISASFIAGTAFFSIGGWLINQRINPKEKEYEANFARIEKHIDKVEKDESEAKKLLKKEIEELRKDIEKKDEKRDEESRKQMAILHSIDVQLVKFNVGFEVMKEDIKELKDKFKKEE